MDIDRQLVEGGGLQRRQLAVSVIDEERDRTIEGRKLARVDKLLAEHACALRARTRVACCRVWVHQRDWWRFGSERAVELEPG